MWTVCWCLCLTHNKLILDLGLGMLEWVNQVVNITIKCVQCSPADWLRSCSQCCWLPKNHLIAEDDTSFGDVQKKDGCSAFRIKAHMQPDHPPHCTYQHILLSPFETLYLWGTSHVVTPILPLPSFINSQIYLEKSQCPNKINKWWFVMFKAPPVPPEVLVLQSSPLEQCETAPVPIRSNDPQGRAIAPRQKICKNVSMEGYVMFIICRDLIWYLTPCISNSNSC